MEQVDYKLRLSFDLGKAIGEVGALFDSLNASFAKFSITERFSCRSTGLSLTLRCDRKLKTQEKAMIKAILEHSFRKKFPAFDFRVESIRCQHCSKSRSQSQ